MRPFLVVIVNTVLMIASVVSAQTMTSFENAILRNDLPTVKKLAAEGKTEFGSRPMPLRLAAAKDAKDIAEWLMANGTDLDFYDRDDNGQLPLDVPPGEELNATRKFLREINKSRSDFLDAVGKQDIERVKRMLAEDKSLAISRDIGDGWSVVMMACHFGNAPLLEVLIAAGAPLDATDFNNGQDAVMVCAEKGQADCLRQLIKAKVHINRTARINYGRLPMEMNALHMAAWKMKPAVVSLLIEAGVDVNERAKSYAMFSPLQFAATEGDAESVALLLKAGADKEARDGRRNINALQMAEAGKHQACVDLLKK
jgi:hypothetical protein